MGAKQNECLQRSHGRARSWAMLGVLALLYGCVLLPVSAQTFNSGSTGADGALSDTVFPASCTKNSSSLVITCTLPESGVYNFTTINLPQGYTLKFNRNSRNTPVTLLASGNVTIGKINLNGTTPSSTVVGFGARPPGGLGGPGGFDGGGGGFKFDPFFSGIGGDGPGGGGGGGVSGVTLGGGGGGGFFTNGTDGNSSNAALIGRGGLRYATKTLLPLIGGSGGGGGAGVASTFGGGGGGGGGAIVLASSGTINFTSASFSAYGGEGESGSFFGCGFVVGAGGGGAGGAIRIVATTISGNVSFAVNGGGGAGSSCGPSYPSGGNGSKGYVRIEAYNYNSFTPSFSPDNSVASFGLPSPVTLTPNTPQITITSVAGQTPANPPTGSLHSPPDVQLPASQANPIAVALSAANIPVGTVITVTVTPETGGQVAVQSTPLAGTTAASTATANVNLSQGMNLINAAAIIDLSAGGNRKTALLIEGERVKRIEVSASYGGTSELTYITESGRKIKRKAE